MQYAPTKAHFLPLYVPVSNVDPSLIHLFMKEKIYVLPEDQPPFAAMEALVVEKVAQVAPIERGGAAFAMPSGLKSVPKALPVEQIPNRYALPKLPPKALAVLIHHPGPELLDDGLTIMLHKLCLATEADANLHVQLAGDMALYPWPAAWHPWAARLTLLLGWPAALLARHRVAEPFRVLRFASAKIIAAAHPAELEADRALKARLWAVIQEAR